MKKFVINIICTAGLAALFFSPVQAQNYQTAAGLRFGGNSGFTLKHFIRSDRAIEGIVSWWGWGAHYGNVWRLTGLYELHKQFTGVDNLYWFYGLGAHVGFGSYRYWYGGPWGYWENRSFVAFGVDGILGLEYMLPDIPFTVGVDIHPFLEINTIGAFPFPVEGALTIRYIF